MNPPQRDVVSTGAAGDNVTIRFTTNNPGPWFLHCHIDFHLEAGFAVVLAEDIPDISAENTPTCEWLRASSRTLIEESVADLLFRFSSGLG